MAALTRLVSLDLDGCRAAKDLRPLAACTCLAMLNLASVLCELGTFLPHAWPALTSLNICTGNLTPLGLCTTLTDLCIFGGVAFTTCCHWRHARISNPWSSSHSMVSPLLRLWLFPSRTSVPCPCACARKSRNSHRKGCVGQSMNSRSNSRRFDVGRLSTRMYATHLESRQGSRQAQYWCGEDALS